MCTNENLFNLANLYNYLELWFSRSKSIGRCIGCNSSLLFKCRFKKILNKLIILKKNIYFDNMQ